MHVLLVGAEIEENLALRYLASSLARAGHGYELATFDRASDTDAVVEAAMRGSPAIVGLSMTFQFRAKEFGALAQALRDAGYRGHITAGGHFPTFAYREVLEAFPAIDSIVRHEGELTLPELCEAVASRRALADIRGLAFRGDDGVVVNDARPLIEDLDALPFAVRAGAPQLHLGVPAAFLVGTRGCYGHCTFCCIHAYLKSAGGPMYRARSAENVCDEIAELRATRGARMLVFHDDDFFTRDRVHDLARMNALRAGLARRDVTDVALVVKARPDDVDPEVFATLKDIGLLRVYLGIEAGSTQGLRVLGRGVDIAANRRALAYLRQEDIYTCFNMLVFDPESTLRSLRESFRFLRDYPEVPMNFCRTEIYVGTPLMTKLAREGRLVGDVFGWDYRIREPAAERAFRVFARAFLDRNFRCDGLMNANLGLGYHLHLLRQFYPRAMTTSLRRLVDGVTRKVNLDCVERMEAIFEFAESPASKDAAAFEDFTERTTREVEAASRRLEDEVAAATDEIVRVALSPRRAARVPRWQAISAAAVALAPLACDRPAQPPPPDPLPIPTLVVGPDAPATATATATATTIAPATTTATATALPPPDPPPPPMVIDAGAPKPRPRPPPPPDPLPPPHTK